MGKLRELARDRPPGLLKIRQNPSVQALLGKIWPFESTDIQCPQLSSVWNLATPSDIWLGALESHRMVVPMLLAISVDL